MAFKRGDRVRFHPEAVLRYSKVSKMFEKIKYGKIVAVFPYAGYPYLVAWRDEYANTILNLPHPEVDLLPLWEIKIDDFIVYENGRVGKVRDVKPEKLTIDWEQGFSSDIPKDYFEVIKIEI